MQSRSGKKTLRRRVLNSPLFGMASAVLLMLMLSASIQAQNITAKVYRQGASGNAYGKLHIPVGGKYKITMYPAADVLVGVFRAHIDGQNIYLSSLDPYGGTYWIDATDVEQNFLVRTSDGSDVVAVPVTADDETLMKQKRWFFYDASDARRNNFRYTTSGIDNATLREDSYFAGCPVYVMANPAKYGLAFAFLDKDAKTIAMPKGSLYVVGDEGSLARSLNVVFDDDVENEATAVTAPKSVASESTSDDACYTLQGLRIAEPLPGTLYIKNGRKFVAK